MDTIIQSTNINNNNNNNNNNKQDGYLLPSTASNDLSIKKERGPPSLRKKQSQRFTVTHNQPAPVPELPPLPRATDTHPNRTPSVSSTSDSDFLSPSFHRAFQQQPYMSQPPHSAGAQQGLSAQYTGSSAALSRTGTALSSVGSLSAGPNSTAGSGMANNNAPNNTGTDPDDEVIPTAIVIKNIPFSVRREQLLGIIDDLQIPAPYAFNYHFDNGVFRGLAFANFRSSTEADAAVAGLNGFDIGGRKLRVEYKKVLQAGEKERIEKEKAIKRMRSMQLQKDGLLDPYPLSSSSTHLTFSPGPAEDEYRLSAGHLPPSIPHRPSASVLNAAHAYSPGPYSGTSVYSPALQPAQMPQLESLSLSESRPAKELDMNDPQTLELYSRVVVFKEDKLRDELAFAKSLSGAQRRIVHQIAKRLGLEHRSEGAGEERFVVVAKGPPRMGRSPNPANMVRAASGQQHPPLSSQAYPSPTSALLRMKKSMPDMRGREMLGTAGATGGSPFGDSRGLGARKSTVNLRDIGGAKSGQYQHHPYQPASGSFGGHSFHHQQHQQQPHGQEESLLANFAGAGGPGGSNAGQIIRQPKGPESCLGRGFAKPPGSSGNTGGTASGTGGGSFRQTSMGGAGGVGGMGSLRSQFGNLELFGTASTGATTTGGGGGSCIVSGGGGGGGLGALEDEGSDGSQ